MKWAIAVLAIAAVIAGMGWYFSADYRAERRANQAIAAVYAACETGNGTVIAERYVDARMAIRKVPLKSFELDTVMNNGMKLRGCELK